MPNIVSGGFQPVSGTAGYDMPRQDGIFIRTQMAEEMRIEDRENELKLITMFGEKLGLSKSKPGETYLVPTLSNLAVGDVTDTVTSSGFSFPDYIATDAPTISQGNTFSKKIGAGTSMLGIPLPLQAANEGVVQLTVNQYRGTALIFTRRFVETAMSYMKNPSSAYGAKIRYAITNDMEEYCWLSWLYTGPITASAADYGTSANAFTDAIGLSNRTNYALTRTLTSINGASNLITPTSTGSPTTGMSNTGNARFSNYSVPWLFGSTSSDISFDTISRLEESFNQRNVPLEGRAILAEPKGYNNIIYLPQFANTKYYPGAGSAMSDSKIPGKILTFNVDYSNVIQAAGASSNVLYEIAGTKGVLLYETQREAELIIDNKMNKPELCTVVMATIRYGAVIQRPDHAAVIQTRTRPAA